MTSRTPVDVEVPAPTLPKPGFEPDVDGLRALVIVMVVAYHCNLPGFSGGCIGVDVFFVRSLAFSWDAYRIAEQLVRDAIGGIPALDVNKMLCASTTRPVEHGNLCVYDDDGHVSQQKIVTFVPQVECYLRQLVG